MGGTATVERESLLLRAMAHPMRRAILESLSDEEACVCHLSALLDKPQPYVSKYLAELREAGLVLDRRHAQRIYYRLADPRVAEMLAMLRAISGRAEQEYPERLTGCACPRCT